MVDNEFSSLIPSGDEIPALAARIEWPLDPALTDIITDSIADMAQSYRLMGEWASDIEPAINTTRDRGQASTDPAWAWTCHIQECADGPLSGMTVAVKDSIAVEGLPTVMGSRLINDEESRHIARTDATVVRRLLDAGAIITGKSTTEDLCIGGSSCTSQPEPVDNPVAPGRSAGGSSSGSAALLARGEVDLALGADQGGSIRIPAALCGVVGLKPTFGLIPFTGIQGLVWSMDHVGPMARDVATVARALDALAGFDGIDRRGRGAQPPRAIEHLAMSTRGLRIGILTEGFALTEQGEGASPGSHAASELVREITGRLTTKGMTVQEVALPWHARARHLYGPLLIESAVLNLWRSYGRATADIGWAGDTPIRAITEALHTHPELASPPTHLVALAGEWFLRATHGRSLDDASRLVLELTRSYDDALSQVDIFIHPTTAPAGVAGPLSTDPVDMIVQSLSYFHNTCVTNLTGHPSASVPAGAVDGVPVGAHISGRHDQDGVVLAVAAAIESIVSP